MKNLTNIPRTSKIAIPGILDIFLKARDLPRKKQIAAISDEDNLEVRLPVIRVK